VARCVTSAGTSATRPPPRTASIVIAASTPKPAAGAGALPRQRRGGAEPRRPANAPACETSNEPEPAAGLPGRDRDHQIGPAEEDLPKDRLEVRGARPEIGVREQPDVGRRQSFQGTLERASLPASPGRSQHRGAGLLGSRCGLIARAVVGDDHEGHGRNRPERSDRRSDVVGLIVGGDESDHARLRHAPGSRGGKISAAASP
jgi:hypothetical protein